MLLPRAVLSLRADLRESLSTRERQSKSVALRRSLEERTNQQYAPQELLGFLLKTFPPLPLPGAAGFKIYVPAPQGRGIACTVLEPAL